MMPLIGKDGNQDNRGDDKKGDKSLVVSHLSITGNEKEKMNHITGRV
jgi:hypothetical protein